MRRAALAAGRLLLQVRVQVRSLAKFRMTDQLADLDELDAGRFKDISRS